MRLNNKLFLLLQAFLFSLQLTAQQNKDVQQTVEEIVEETNIGDAEEYDYTQLTGDLYDLASKPLDINRATTDDLHRIPFLSDFQVNSIINYRTEHGPLLSIYELANIYGFDAALARQVEPFVYINPTGYEPLQKEYWDHTLFQRVQRCFEKQQGYSTNNDGVIPYAGNPLKLYSRYNLTYGKRLHAGFTAEKDPGEDFFNGSNKQGFDFYSFHLQYNGKRLLQNFCLGDFQAHFGQGLTLGTGMAFSSFTEAGSLCRYNNGFKPYISSSESGFLRGAAITLGNTHLALSLFGSHKKIDANTSLIDTLSGEILQISSLPEGGMHRTSSELANEGLVKENTLGGAIDYKNTWTRITAIYSAGNFSIPLAQSDELYQSYNLKGRSYQNTGIAYQFLYKQIRFFGEMAMSGNKGIASLNGLQLQVNNSLSIGILYRYYQKQYQARYSNAVGLNSGNKNENAFYSGFNFSLYNKLRLRAYIDIASFPWLRYRDDSPGWAQNYFTQFDWAPLPDFSCSLRFRSSGNTQNGTSTDALLPKQIVVKKQSYRLHFAYKAFDFIEFRDRIEVLNYKVENTKEEGYLLYHDIIYKTENKPLSLALRVALFETDSWNSRIYAYENDVLYAFSFPAYYNKGIRTYLMINTHFGKHWEVWFRIARTRYANQSTNGSGLNTINAPHRTDASIQLAMRF